MVRPDCVKSLGYGGQFRRAFVEAGLVEVVLCSSLILHSWALVVGLVELCMFWESVWESRWSAFKRCLGYRWNGEAEVAGVAG